MIEVKTAELIGPALDWAVAQAVGVEVGVIRPPVIDENNQPALLTNKLRWLMSGEPAKFWLPSTDWSQGGPLIAKFGVLLSPPKSMMHVGGGPNAGWRETGRWGSTIFGKDRKHRRACFDHKTEPLVAAMLAIVQFELGDVAQVPAELVAGCPA